MVERFEEAIDIGCFSNIYDDPNGKWVKHEAYAALESKLDAATRERDEHRKALNTLSAYLHNPALEPDDDKSFSDALVAFAIQMLGNYKDGWNATDDAWGKEVAELESRLDCVRDECEAFVRNSSGSNEYGDGQVNAAEAVLKILNDQNPQKPEGRAWDRDPSKWPAVERRDPKLPDEDFDLDDALRRVREEIEARPLTHEPIVCAACGKATFTNTIHACTP